MNRKQKLIVTSTIEADYMTFSTCVKKNLWRAQFLKNMSFTKYFEIEFNQVFIVENVKHENSSSVQFMKNNQAVNFLIKNVYIHERSKHIDVIYHHIRNSYKKNLIQLNYFSSLNMMTNDLTKSLSKNKFKTFVKQLRLRESKISEN